MGDIVNMRQFKKNKARDSRNKQAEQNRVLFGRTKAEKDFAKEETRKAENFLTNNKLESRNTPESGDA